MNVILGSVVWSDIIQRLLAAAAQHLSPQEPDCQSSLWFKSDEGGNGFKFGAWAVTTAAGIRQRSPLRRDSETLKASSRIKHKTLAGLSFPTVHTYSLLL